MANLLGMTYAELVTGTDYESFIFELTSDRFCLNHNEPLFIPRYSLGGENKFCLECGEKAGGDCPECGTPYDQRLSDYCYVCGNKLADKYPKFKPDSDLLSEIEDEQSFIDGNVYEMVLGFSHDAFKHFGPIKLCLTSHKRRRFKYNSDKSKEIETVEIEVQYKCPAFGLFGPMNYCPDCGGELLASCPKCDKPFALFVTDYKKQNLKLKFCSGCGYDISSLIRES